MTELTEGHKKAIVGMFAHGSSIPDLAEWYGVDQATIREILRPYVRLGEGRPVRSGRNGAPRRG